MAMGELDGQSSTERVADDVGSLQAQGLDEPGQAVGVVGQAERLRRVVGRAAAGGVPGYDGELVREIVELAPPHPAVAHPAVEEHDRRTVPRPPVPDAQAAHVDARQGRNPSGHQVNGPSTTRQQYQAAIDRYGR